MASVNKVILVGHLGKDPDLSYTPQGKAVCKTSLATSERYNDEDHVEWHNLVIWGKPGEVIGQYCKKGSQIYVEGKIRTESWEDREGNKKYAVKVYVNSVVLLGGNGGKKEPSTPVKPIDAGDDIPF